MKHPATAKALLYRKLFPNVSIVTSPKELGLSEDDRKLGIGFISMKIVPSGDDNR